MHISLIQFSCSVVFHSLWSHGLQNVRLPCLTPNPRACWNSCPSSLWSHKTFSSSVIPFSSCLQSFPASGSFLWVSSHKVAKVLELRLQYHTFQWTFCTDFLENWLVWSSCCPRALKSLLQHPSSIALILWCSTYLKVQLSHPYMTTGKTIAWTKQTFVGKVMSLLFTV